MKIAIYSPNIMKTYGGLERASYWLYTKLTLKGIDVTFLVFDYKENEPERYKFEQLPKNVVINPFKKDLMKKIMNSGRYDCVIVFASHPYTPYICDALKETKIPWIYAERTEAESLENLYKRRFQNPKAKRLQMINNCSAMVLQLDEYSKSVPEARRHKLRIIPNTCAIKPDRKRSTNPDKKILLSLGRLSDNQKQISILINAFSVAAAGLNNWELHIYGNGPNEAKLKLLANSKTNKSIIKFNGVSKHPSDQYSTSDVFCLPSKFEGFPNTVIEAFTHALPVVAFKDCTAARSIITDGYNGILADKMDANSLANSLKKVMSSPDLVNKLSIGAEETSKKYDEDTIFNMWLDVINFAIKNRHHVSR